MLVCSCCVVIVVVVVFVNGEIEGIRWFGKVSMLNLVVLIVCVKVCIWVFVWGNGVVNLKCS